MGPADARRWLGFMATWLFAQRTRDFAWGKQRRLASTGLFNIPEKAITIAVGILLIVLEIIGMVGLFASRAHLLDSAHLLLISGAAAGIGIPFAIYIGRDAEPRELSKRHAWWDGRYKTESSSFWESLKTPPGRELSIFGLNLLPLSISIFFAIFSLPVRDSFRPAIALEIALL